MRKAAVQLDSAPANADDPQLLVLGYHGTLQPDPASHAAEPPPPQMEALLEPILAGARLELNRRLPKAQRVLSGEPIPVDASFATLRQRLQEILTLPLAAQLSATNRPDALTQDHRTREYPALDSLLRQTALEFVTAIVTFHDRLQRDSSRLAQWLGLASLPPVESVSGTTSDLHPGGHLVLRVVFRGGISIYYKPRPVTGEWLWHKLLQSIADAEPCLRLPSARVLPGSNPARYGWMESVLQQETAHRGHAAPANALRYWHAAGAMLCLAYHAALTDLHLGNIIATPAGPSVTDAECLAAPSLYAPATHTHPSPGTRFETFFQRLSATGLLPGKDASNLPDTSGLFATAAPVPFLRLPQWSIAPNGQSRLMATPATLLDHGNSPDGASPLAVLPQLLAGYREAACALLRHREKLLALESPWRIVLERHHSPRIVLRETLAYALLLSRSLAPDPLRSQHRRRSILRDALLDPPVAGLPASVLRAEVHSLLHLHIPRLAILPGTRTLAAASANPLAHRFTRTTPAQEVIGRIDDLSTENLEAVHLPALTLAVLPTRCAAQSL